MGIEWKILENRGAQKLTGSDKQIVWATEIRSEFLHACEKRLAETKAGDHYNKDKRIKIMTLIISRIPLVPHASLWIDRRESTNREIVSWLKGTKLFTC